MNPSEDNITTVPIPGGTRVTIAGKGKDEKSSLQFDFIGFVTVKGISRGKLVVTPIQEDKKFQPLELSVSTSESREPYVRQIKAAFGRLLPDVTLELSTAFGAFMQAAREQEANKILILADVVPKPSMHLLHPFLEKGLPNLLYARGGVGKTTLAYRMAISIVSGIEMFGVKPAEEDVGDVLVVDYENTPEMSAVIMRKVACDVPGVTEEMLRRIHYVSMSLSFSEVAERIREVTAKYDLKLVIIDSGAPAVGGAPEDATVVSLLFIAIRQLGTTTLILGHVAKADTNLATPIGSIFWENFARNTYTIEVHERKSPTTQILVWKHKKRNSGPLVDDLYYSMVSGKTGVKFTLLDDVMKKTAKQVIVELLTEHEELTREQLKDLSELDPDAIRRTTNRMKKDGAASTKDKGKSWRLIK